MKIIHMYHEITDKQINLLTRYLMLIREIEAFERKLNGQISQADLLLNSIVERSVDLSENQIIEEQRNLYKMVFLKNFAQMNMRNMQKFKSIFKPNATSEEIEMRINDFAEYNKKMLAKEKSILSTIRLIEGEENGTEKR